jgi:putative endonuclease
MRNLKGPSSASLGKKGEERAAASLKASGMKIIARNYRSKFGEVDIVAQCGEVLVFAEVKAWSYFGVEDLQYGLNARKQQKIIKTAKYFLFENREYSNMPIRFDVLYVKNNDVTHLASAFMESV